MEKRIDEDLTEMTNELNKYVNNGRAVGSYAVEKEPTIGIKPHACIIRSGWLINFTRGWEALG